MPQLRGGPALSEFRSHKLLEQIRERVPEVVRLAAVFLHVAELEERLSGDEQALLERLLEYGPQRQDEVPDGFNLVVVPRPGTISPWSSKATDIIHNCGLSKVRRVVGQRRMPRTFHAPIGVPIGSTSSADQSA